MTPGDRPVLCVVGATAVGKTEVAVALARGRGGEVICCDALTVYRGLSILTAKPSPPWDQPGVGRLAMIKGPEGAPIYLMNPLPPEGQPDAFSDVFSVDEAQRVRWNELWSSDPERSIAFYKRHFGWEQEGDMDMGEMGKYRFVQSGDVTIGAVMPTMPDMPGSLWNFYFGVDDIDRAAEAVKSGGGQMINGPMEIPGGEYAMNAVDPQGAQVGFVGPRK